MDFRTRDRYLAYLRWLHGCWELNEHEQVAFAYAKLRGER